MTAPIEIEFRPRLDKRGEKIRGDRDFYIAGERWGYLVMEGGRYRWLVIHDSHGHTIPQKWTLKKGSEKFQSYRTAERVKAGNRWEKDRKPLLDVAVDQLRELIAEGRLKSPAKLKAAADKHSREWDAANAAREADRTLMRVTLIELYQQANDPDRRRGLALAYEDIFHGTIEDRLREAIASMSEEATS